MSYKQCKGSTLWLDETDDDTDDEWEEDLERKGVNVSKTKTQPSMRCVVVVFLMVVLLKIMLIIAKITSQDPLQIQ